MGSVLIVDDIARNARLIERLLAPDGHMVPVTSLDDTASRIRMEGDELARQLRILAPCLRVLYLTSHVDKLFEAKPQLWADEVYLDKPFTREGLREAVALVLFGRKNALAWQ